MEVIVVFILIYVLIVVLNAIAPTQKSRAERSGYVSYRLGRDLASSYTQGYRDHDASVTLDQGEDSHAHHARHDDASSFDGHGHHAHADGALSSGHLGGCFPADDSSSDLGSCFRDDDGSSDLGSCSADDSSSFDVGSCSAGDSSSFDFGSCSVDDSNSFDFASSFDSGND